jgi:hypothetical protein
MAIGGSTFTRTPQIPRRSTIRGRRAGRSKGGARAVVSEDQEEGADV